MNTRNELYPSQIQKIRTLANAAARPLLSARSMDNVGPRNVGVSL